MAAKLSGPSGKGGVIEQNADINVTPFVDVMLVLLIIFMVSAPLATVSIRLDLPPPVPPPENAEPPPPPTFISIALDGTLYVTTGEEAPESVTLEGLDSELYSRLGSREERVMIRADADVLYNDFMVVMNDLQSKGWFQVGLINEDIS
ncbi:biopolymer transporter ExbD [Brevundimonas sp.]|uniref:biopolymer transporter ExbD n=1 Tax=Brevundimonas sp. TaxID=1871086 RepID=UPI0025FE07C8|nr:biopolymer transporter ExbD [Brevundimonas sp.]